MLRAHFIVLLPTIVAIVPIGTVASQPPAAVSYPASFSEPIKLYEVLGSFGRQISTTSREAQAYFDQGIRLIFAFDLQDAARSFREAQKRDPQCAMCYFGEAWAWGPYLNGAMSGASAPRAYAAIQQALQLRENTRPVERALIDAMSIRYVEVHNPGTRAALDTAYSGAMEKLYSQYRNDLDVGTLYAESLMLLNRSRGTYEVDQPHVQKFHSVLEAILRRDVRHPGACHLYIHATEATRRPDKAENCAQYLGGTIPGASHINHMPSHTFNRVGRWGDAVRANIDAWHTDMRAGTGDAVAIGPTHNLQMLLFAASYDGQGAIATQAARDYAKLVPSGTQHIALTLLRFGRFDEVLALQRAPSAEGSRLLWEFARGYSHLRLNSSDSARFYLARLDGGSGGGGRTGSLVTIVRGILRGELLRSEGQLAEAIAALEAAVAVEDDLSYAEPEPLPFSARHWLGAMLLEAKRPGDAEGVYTDDLVRHPRNGWSLHGLSQALSEQGRTGEAAKVRTELEESWSRSDTLLRGSRF